MVEDAAPGPVGLRRKIDCAACRRGRARSYQMMFIAKPDRRVADVTH